MDLINHTNYPGYLFRATVDETRLAASVLMRVTYNIVGKELVPSSEQIWKASPTPWNTDYGQMEGDEVFRKGGVDLLVFGHARAPNGDPVQKLEIKIEAGALQNRLMVFGDRVWTHQGEALVPSAPKPFQSIPLTMQYAYGGKIEWDGLEIPYPDNPDGKGYYSEEENAVGQPLPNIENPDNLIQNWNDNPVPSGIDICPMASGWRLRNGIEFDENGAVEALHAKFFNAAYPDMIVTSILPGERVRLTGVDEAGPLTFEVPPTRLMVRLKFDKEIIERKPAIDQLGIEVDQRRVFITYRYPFRYIMYPLQKRSCEVFLMNADSD